MYVREIYVSWQFKIEYLSLSGKLKKDSVPEFQESITAVGVIYKIIE